VIFQQQIDKSLLSNYNKKTVNKENIAANLKLATKTQFPDEKHFPHSKTELPTAYVHELEKD